MTASVPVNTRATLLLRLAGPMQSWGTQSRFSVRDTGLEPSKSGVIGLLCAALGRGRDEPVDDLAALRMAVRVDREGVMRSDYHTAGGWHRREDEGYGVPNPAGGGHRTVLSTRYYLADADFLVGLEGDRALLEQVDDALRQPRWQIFLGRKAFLPGAPVHLPDEGAYGPGLQGEPLEAALASIPWLGSWLSHRREEPPATLRLVIEPKVGDTSGIQETRMDVPLSFAERRFAGRIVTTREIATGRLGKGEGDDDVPVETDA